MAWTDDELREAIDKAERPGVAVILRTNVPNNRTYHLDALRAILTSLGIDHQPKPGLPDVPGSMVYDVALIGGSQCRVMELDCIGRWNGYLSSAGHYAAVAPNQITSFGGVLDLDKVRGEQSE